MTEGLQARIARLEMEQGVADRLLAITRDLNAAEDEQDLIEVLSGPARDNGAFMSHLIYVDLGHAGELEWAEVAATWQRGDIIPIVLQAGMRFSLSEYPVSAFLFANPNEPLVISDVAKSDRLDENSRNLLLQMNCQATVVIPLNVANLWTGVLVLDWDHAREFGEQEMALYRALPALASPVVQNHRLLGSLQKTISQRDEQQQFLRSVLDASPGTIYLKDKNSVYLLCNEAFARHHDMTVADIVGRSMSDLWPADQVDLYRQDDLDVLAGNEVIVEHLIERASGDYFYETIKEPFRNEKGEIVGLIAFDRDITERKRAEIALAEEQSLLRTLIDAVPDHIYAKDIQGRILLANLAQARALGFEHPKELVGRIDFDFYSKEAAEKIIEADQVVYNSNKPVKVEETWVDQEGRTRWFSSLKVPLRDTNDQVIGLVGMSREITDQKLLEEKAEQERLQQQVIEAQKRAIQELSTPIIPIMDRVIVMPLIGSIDTLRSRDIMRVLLSGINEYKARVVILDITGVPIVDTAVASHLNKTIQAARLKGAHTIITGISDALAETIVDLGLDWSGIETLDNLQTGLLVALSRLGIRLARDN